MMTTMDNYDKRPWGEKYGKFVIVMAVFIVAFVSGAIFLSC